MLLSKSRFKTILTLTARFRRVKPTDPFSARGFRDGDSCDSVRSNINNGHRWEIWQPHISRDGRYFACTANHLGYNCATINTQIQAFPIA